MEAAARVLSLTKRFGSYAALDAVSFAQLDYVGTDFAAHPLRIIELINEVEDSQTHSVFQGGQLLSQVRRPESTGGVEYELDHPVGIDYVSSQPVGLSDAFRGALLAAGVTTVLKAL